MGAGGFLLDKCLYTVPAGERGIIFDRFRGGIQDQAAGEGAHLLMPFIQKVDFMDVRTKPKVISTETGTKDLQTVKLSLRVLYKPDPERIAFIYKERGADYAARILPSFGNEVLKAIVAQYNADQLLTLRAEISKRVREEMSKRCAEYDILLDDVSITHLNFSADFTRAIEDKQVAEQMAERAKFVVMKVEQEKRAMVTKSEGDSQAADIFGEAVAKHGTGYIEIRRIEAALQVADTLGRARGNITYLPKNQNMLLNLPSK